MLSQHRMWVTVESQGKRRLTAQCSGRKQILRQADACCFESIDERWSNTGGFEVAIRLAIGVDAVLDEAEDVLHDDRVLLHVQDFGDVGDLSRATESP